LVPPWALPYSSTAIDGQRSASETTAIQAPRLKPLGEAVFFPIGTHSVYPLLPGEPSCQYLPTALRAKRSSTPLIAGTAGGQSTYCSALAEVRSFSTSLSRRGPNMTARSAELAAAV
jgi:hypothetical protein